MKHRIEVNGNDGMFLTGGNPTHTTLEFEDSFIDSMIQEYWNETDGFYYLMDQVAEDIGSKVYYDVDVDEEEVKLRGYESLADWEATAYPDGVYHYHDADWRITLDSAWGCGDTMALTIARPLLTLLAPYFRERLN